MFLSISYIMISENFDYYKAEFVLTFLPVQMNCAIKATNETVFEVELNLTEFEVLGYTKMVLIAGWPSIIGVVWERGYTVFLGEYKLVLIALQFTKVEVDKKFSYVLLDHH